MAYGIEWYALGDGSSPYTASGTSGVETNHYPFKKLCARVTGLVSGETVVFSYVWTPVDPGNSGAIQWEAPYGPNSTDSGDLGDGSQRYYGGVGYQFGYGTEYGTLVVTATVNGVAVPGAVQAVLAAGSTYYGDLAWQPASAPSDGYIGWCWGPEDSQPSPSNAATDRSGTITSTPYNIYGASLIGGAGGRTIVWTTTWTPVTTDDPPETNTTTTPGVLRIRNNQYPGKYGTLEISATVDGTPSISSLRYVVTPNVGPNPDYGTAAFLYIVPTVEFFWTDYVNTNEIP